MVPGKSMCRLAAAARELIASGGKPQLLCSRKDRKMQYCPHHPQIADLEGCGYQRQQMREVTQKTRVWIIPAIMLGKGPPPPFVRDFDLLVIDEAPWFNLTHDAPTKIPLEWLAPQWWEVRAPHATASQKQCAIDLLAKIFSALASRGIGEVPHDLLIELAITEFDLLLARRTIWRYKVDLRSRVKPGWKQTRLKKSSLKLHLIISGSWASLKHSKSSSCRSEEDWHRRASRSPRITVKNI